MGTNKVKTKRWQGFVLLSVFLLLTLFGKGSNSDSASKDAQENSKEGNSMVTYSTGFDNSPGNSETINGIKYKNYSYFEVKPNQYMEYIYRSGDVVQFFAEGPSNLNIWIVSKQRDSIGSATANTEGLTEYLGNSYYKIRILNKNATKFGAGIRQ
jgi:hypothetical protein